MGRKKGSLNKTTAITKQVITEFLAEYQSSGLMNKDFLAVEAKDRLNFSEKLMQYTMPKIQAVSLDLNSGTQETTIEEELSRLSKDPSAPVPPSIK